MLVYALNSDASRVSGFVRTKTLSIYDKITTLYNKEDGRKVQSNHIYYGMPEVLVFLIYCTEDNKFGFWCNNSNITIIPV